MAGKKGKGGKKKKHYYGRKAKKVVNKTRRKTFRIFKAVALEGPLIMFVAEGVVASKGQPLSARLGDAAGRIAMATTGIQYHPGGKATWQPEYLLLGWGGPLAYKGLQFAVNMIPGKKDSPFAELAALTG
jgi:hypothetical protein